MSLYNGSLCKLATTVASMFFVAATALAQQQTEPTTDPKIWLYTLNPNFDSSGPRVVKRAQKRPSKIDDDIFLAITTKRNSIAPVPGQTDIECTDQDDDCAQNSVLPRAHPHTKGITSFRKPFIGLSIGAPLQ